MGSTSRGLALLGLLLLGGWAWPTNVVTVSNTIDDTDCTGDGTPYKCCTAAGTGFCDDLGGEDIQDALQICELGTDKAAGGATDTNGCVLRLPCNSTFERAENTIYSATPTNRYGIAYTEGFPNGLVIQGCGNSTVLKSSIPPLNDNVAGTETRAVFYFAQWDRDGGTPGTQPGIPHIAFRDFQCYGQSDEQPRFRDGTDPWGPGNPGAGPEIGHTCIENRHGFAPGGLFETVEVKRIYAHDFVTHGITLGDAGSLTVIGNRLSGFGCAQKYGNAICQAGEGAVEACLGAGNPDASCTGVQTGTHWPFLCCTGDGTGSCDDDWNGTNVPTGEIECGRNSGQPDNYGWDLEFDDVGTQYGFKSVGGGFWGGGGGRTLIAYNTVDHAVKYGLDGNANSEYLNYALTDLIRIDRNSLNDGDRIMAGTNFDHVWISNNTVANSGVDGDSYSNSTSIACSSVGSTLRIENNTITGAEGSAINVDCFTSSATGQNRRPQWVTITGNTISGGGQWGEDFGVSIPTMSAYTGYTPANCFSFGNRPQIAGEVTITGNSFGTGKATDQISWHRYSDTDCAGNRSDPLIISTNTIAQPTINAVGQELAFVKGYNIQSTGNILNTDGTWTWVSGATGTCSGWTTNGTTDVSDLSGNGIGDCEP